MKDNTILVVITDAVEFVQYVRFFRAKLLANYDCVHLLLPFTKKKENEDFYLSLSESEVAIDDPNLGSMKIISIAYTAMVFRFRWKNRYLFPHSATFRFRNIKFKEGLKIIAWFLCLKYVARKLINEEDLACYNDILLMRPDSLWAAYFDIIQDDKKTINLFIRNSDSISSRGIVGSFFDTIYVKDRFSHLQAHYSRHIKFQRIVLLGRKKKTFKNFLVVLGDTRWWRNEVFSFLEDLKETIEKDHKIIILVHPNDCKEGLLLEISDYFKDSPNVTVTHKPRFDAVSTQGKNLWFMTLPMVNEYLTFLENVDVVLQVGTTFSNEADFKYVVDYIPSKTYPSGLGKTPLLFEHIRYQTYTADHIIFDRNELRAMFGKGSN